MATNSALVVLTDEFFAGRSKALNILFIPERLTEQQRLDSVRDAQQALRGKDHASLVREMSRYDARVVDKLRVRQAMSSRSLVG